MASHLFPDLPARPLLNAIDAFRGFGEPDLDLGKRVGVVDKTLREWRLHKRRVVTFAKADQVLCNIGLNWWEVWNEETTRKWAITVVAYRKSPWRKSQTTTCKLTDEQIADIRSSDEGPTPLALKHGVGVSTITEIRSYVRHPFGASRERVSVTQYGDLGPDLEAIATARYAFTGEGVEEQLEMAA